MKIAVYGAGRFGTLWASLLKKAGFDVMTVNRTPGRLLPDGLAAGTLEDLSGAEAVFLCCSISSVPEVCRLISPYLSGSAAVIDTCSVKVMPLRWIKENLPLGTPFFGTHPMFGPDSVAAGISGLPLVMCRGEHAERQYDFFLGEFSKWGLNVLQMSADEHDKRAAYTQGITHFIGRVLDDLSLKPDPIGTLGYKKLMEIRTQTCNDPLQLFFDLQKFNPYTKAMHDDLRSSLDRIMAKLEQSLDT
jgi:prephenate dehydrogenase